MKLADRVAQCCVPLEVRDDANGSTYRLNNAANCAAEVVRCPLRFVLSDELTRLCTALAYSQGARSAACAELIRIPGESVWIEWCSEPWQSELHTYGFPLDDAQIGRGGRRGALFRAANDGRRGILRTFWTADGAYDVLASSVEAYFDLDTEDGDEPRPADALPASRLRVMDSAQDRDDVLGRCFRFRYERSWAEYYARARLTPHDADRLWHHALGTIALDIPVVLAFFLLLATRTGLPRQPRLFERLNRSRLKAGKPPLLDHIDVSAPLLPEYRPGSGAAAPGSRRSPRLHHVRGHLVRRGSQLFWRVPHVRGSARLGIIHTRTVQWTVART